MILFITVYNWVDDGSNRFTTSRCTDFGVVLRYKYNRWYTSFTLRISSINALIGGRYDISLTRILPYYRSKEELAVGLHGNVLQFDAPTLE